MLNSKQMRIRRVLRSCEFCVYLELYGFLEQRFSQFQCLLQLWLQFQGVSDVIITQGALKHKECLLFLRAKEETNSDQVNNLPP